jgi:hypothetical protein
MSWEHCQVEDLHLFCTTTEHFPSLETKYLISNDILNFFTNLSMNFTVSLRLSKTEASLTELFLCSVMF